jgi:catechol 2,3-dioxygenase-like lactoylglutathione lyase family enzyme
MRDITRRSVIQGAGGALLLAASPAALAEPRAKLAPVPGPTNPFAACVSVATIVTPDMDASIRFYRDLMGYELARTGRLAGDAPNAPGAGGAGRAYALIRPRENEISGRGVLRILEAPAGAKANRPRPGSTILDAGLGAFECITGDIDQSFDKLTAAGIETVSTPQFYHQDGVKPLPGAVAQWDTGDIEVRTFGAWGPAGELVFSTVIITLGGKPAPAWDKPANNDRLSGCVLLSRDRWPCFAFYDAVFGLKPTKDQFLQQNTVNASIGAPMDTYYHFGGLGQGVGFEWWEYRALRPTPTPPFPTSLDRTGWAMITMVVDDLAAVRGRAKGAGIPILADGALPTLAAERQDGFYVRGALGELIEIVGRDARG